MVEEGILEGEDWKDLVPLEVYEFLMSINGGGRIKDLVKTDRINDDEVKSE